MNQLTEITSVQTMTSREIAELTGKSHFHVIRDIESMMDDIHHPNLDNDDFKGISCARKTYNGRDVIDFYELDYEMTMTLITGYSVKLRNAVIKRWQQLENNQSPALPSTYIEALESLLEAKKKEAALLEQIEEVKPDLEFLDKITHDPSSMSVAQAAKSIGTGERKLYAFMRQNGWVTRDNVPYQDRVNAGHLDYSRSRYDNGKGELKDKYTTRVTEKGKNLLLKQIKLRAPEILEVFRSKQEGLFQK